MRKDVFSSHFKSSQIIVPNNFIFFTTCNTSPFIVSLVVFFFCFWEIKNHYIRLLLVKHNFFICCPLTSFIYMVLRFKVVGVKKTIAVWNVTRNLKLWVVWWNSNGYKIYNLQYGQIVNKFESIVNFYTVAILVGLGQILQQSNCRTLGPRAI